MRLLPVLMILPGCNISAGNGPPEPVRIDSFTASPAEVALSGEVALTWKVSGPVDTLVLAIGDCAVELDPGASSFTDGCGDGAHCPCGASAPGDVLYTLTALGPQDDRTADTATRSVAVHAP